MISSCSSSSLLRSVRALFCLRSDWPIRAANSRSRSFCGGQACAGLLWCHHWGNSGRTVQWYHLCYVWDCEARHVSLTSSSRCVTASMSWYVFVIWPTLSEHSTAEEKKTLRGGMWERGCWKLTYGLMKQNLIKMIVDVRIMSLYESKNTSDQTLLVKVWSVHYTAL